MDVRVLMGRYVIRWDGCSGRRGKERKVCWLPEDKVDVNMWHNGMAITFCECEEHEV